MLDMNSNTKSKRQIMRVIRNIEIDCRSASYLFICQTNLF